MLTLDLIDYLEAPFPYLVGVQKGVWDQIAAKRRHLLQTDQELVIVEVPPLSETGEQESPRAESFFSGNWDIIDHYEHASLHSF